MRLNRELLKEAEDKGIVNHEQANLLWDFLLNRSKDQPSFQFTHILYYVGGLIAIGAMTLFMTLGWDHFGGWGLFYIALGYAVAGLMLTHYFLNAKLPIPAGITATLVVAVTPLAVYGLQNVFGLWVDNKPYHDYHRYIDWRWIYMELATLAVGAIMLWRYRLPFLVMPVAATLWYMSMDLTPLIFDTTYYDNDLYAFVSLWFGLLIALLGFWVDMRTRHVQDYAFWLYIFGVTAFWGGMTATHSDSELNKFVYLCINLLMIGVGAILSRRVFAVFGGLGVAIYLGHLAYGVFKNSMLFPLILTVIGLGIIYLGIIWQKHEAQISQRLRAYLPMQMRELIEKRQ